jgi:hypothetical protein
MQQQQDEDNFFITSLFGKQKDKKYWKFNEI